jgi:hypothetical protein
MSIYYVVEYGFEPQTSETQHLAWKEREKAVDERIGRASFEWFKKNRPSKDGTFANKLDLFLMDIDEKREIIVTHLAWHLFREVYRTKTLEDRPHVVHKPTEVRAVAPVAEGVWIVLEKSLETAEQRIVGVARTSGGVQKLIDIIAPVMDDIREVTVKYFSFIEGT